MRRQVLSGYRKDSSKRKGRGRWKECRHPYERSYQVASWFGCECSSHDNAAATLVGVVDLIGAMMVVVIWPGVGSCCEIAVCAGAVCFGSGDRVSDTTHATFVFLN